MGTQDYYRQLSRMSVSELAAELQSEIQALNEILSDEPYDDRGRQIAETRENIRMIKQYIDKKSH